MRLLVLLRWPIAALAGLAGGLLPVLAEGRLHSHLHLFVLLAAVALYRQWRLVAVSAGLMIAALVGLGGAPAVVPALWAAVGAGVLIVATVRPAVAQPSLAAQAEAALAEQNAHLRASQQQIERLAQIGQLAASVGHDLRNPLAAVRNALAYVSKRALDPNATAAVLSGDRRVAQFLTLMDHELGVCSRMVDDLLDFSRDRPTALAPCPLSGLVDDAVSLIPVAPHVKVKNEVPHSLPVPLLDKEQFRQALINLIQNGVESIPTNRAGSVTIRAEGGTSTPLRITISDDGIGIPDDVIPKIFQPLFTTKAKGTGLGLPIVAGMIQRHGGTISVTSGKGQGSTFAVELPPVALAA